MLKIDLASWIAAVVSDRLEGMGMFLKALSWTFWSALFGGLPLVVVAAVLLLCPNIDGFSISTEISSGLLGFIGCGLVASSMIDISSTLDELKDKSALLAFHTNSFKFFPILIMALSVVQYLVFKIAPGKTSLGHSELFGIVLLGLASLYAGASRYIVLKVGGHDA